MNKVYIVEGHIDYEGFEILGVFDSQDKAMDYVMGNYLSKRLFKQLRENVWRRMDYSFPDEIHISVHKVE